MQNCDEKQLMTDVSKQIKDFYESSVVFITGKDYSESIFNDLCALHEALLEQNKSRVLDLIVDSHLKWLKVVSEIEAFIKEDYCPKDELFHKIHYTVDCLSYRLKVYRKYMDDRKRSLNSGERANLQSDYEIIEEMHTEATEALLAKINEIDKLPDKEYKSKLTVIIDELLLWVDKMNDGLSMKISKYVNANIPHLSGDLTKTLQQVIDDIKNTNNEAAEKLITEMRSKGKQLSSLVRFTAGHNIEMDKVFEKINVLDDRIKRLEIIDEKGPKGPKGPSAALMALKHKKEYLESRMASLEKLKTNLKSLQEAAGTQIEDVPADEVCVCEDFFQLRIFNHLLPIKDRERLVTDLCFLWDKAVNGEGDKSIISILSAAEVQEEFTDELGTFIIDEHSRKIYKLPDDETRYQPNDLQQLVPVSDDENHIYFYDECGRYFIDETRQRVYKAHPTASEYMMDSSGVLLKIKEERDGVTYYYDNYGRYYIDRDGKHIYRDEDSLSEYENDGLGNLVRIRDHLDIFKPCPGDVNVTEDFKYLKEVIAKPLRVCIAQVIIHQPSDPIGYLSKALIKYRENIELRDKLARESVELNAEREIIAEEERARAEREALEAALLAQGGSEVSFDSNMARYREEDATDSASVKKTSDK